MDIRTVQHHSEGQAYSRSFYKGAVRDAGRTVYQGLIDVRHEALLVGYAALEKSLGIRLVRVGGPEQVHRDVGVDEDQGRGGLSPYPDSISASI